MFLYLIGSIIYWASMLYTLILLARVAFDWVRFFAPRWTPRGPILLLANLIYSLTDPPVRFMRRFIPPLRLGNVALDVGFLVIFVAVTVLGRIGFQLMWLGR